jgi:hypothetical protein
MALFFLVVSFHYITAEVENLLKDKCEYAGSLLPSLTGPQVAKCRTDSNIRTSVTSETFSLSD